MRIKATKKHLEARLKERSPEYLIDISPAMVKKYADGSMEFETEHLAWIAAMRKYKPVRQALSSFYNTKCAEFRQQCGDYQKIKECSCVLGKTTPCKQRKIPVEKLICEKGYFNLSKEKEVVTN